MNAEDVLFEIKKFDLKEGDVIFISYPYRNDLAYLDYVDEVFNNETWNEFCKERKVNILYFPGDFRVEIKHRDEMIEQLELIIKELRNGDPVHRTKQD